MEHNNDILVAVIVPKNNLKVAYDTVRLSKTDFPLLTCAVSVIEDKMRVVIGARPTKARFLIVILILKQMKSVVNLILVQI